jgi:hypothetical protein
VGANVPDVTSMMARSASPAEKSEAPERAAVAQPAWVALLMVAVGPTNLRCLLTMADRLRELGAGRWPRQRPPATEGAIRL